MKTIAHRTRMWQLAVPTILCSALLLLLAPSHAAANYTVYQLEPSRGVGQNGWASFGDGGFYRLDFGSMLQVTGVHNGSYTPAGYWAAWRTPGLPGGLYIDQVSYESYGSAQPGRGVGAGLCVDGEAYHLYCANDQLLYLPAENQWFGRFASRPGSKFFKLVMSCGSNCPATTWTNGAVRNMAFTMRDDAAPSVNLWGGSLQFELWGAPDPTAWNSGTETLVVHGTDGSSGVEHDLIAFDHDVNHPQKQSWDASCNRVAGGYWAFVPCWSVWDFTHSIDTTQFADGGHALHAFTYDASGNPAQVNATFLVDNTDPAEPASVDVLGDNENGWQSVNDFDLAWVNGGETVTTGSQSGLARACFDVDPAEGQASDPAPVCVDGAMDALSDVQVPADGQWSAEVWTQDKAGNESDRAQVGLRLDTTVPGRAPGRANGWVGLPELLGGKYQWWDWPANHEAVNSGLCGYGLSVSREHWDEAPASINVTGDVFSGPIPPGTPEGINWVHFRAISCAGLYGPSEHVELKVDLTKPRAIVTGIPPSGWTNAPGQVNVAGTDAMPGSGMDPAPPIREVRDGASVRFGLDGVTADEVRGAYNASFDASAVAEGPHSLTVTTFDWARNYDEQTFGYGVDKTPPSGTFTGADPSDPTVFKVATADALSGAVGGEVQYAPLSDADDPGAYKPLATSFQGGQLAASFPDTKLPQGRYALRAIVRDAATNEGLVTKNVHGERMVISNPLRDSVGLEFMGTVGNKACKRKRARTRAMRLRARKLYKTCKRKRATGKVTDIAVSARYGRATMLRGTLTDRRGQPLSSQKIEIYQQRTGDSLRLVAGSTTDASGQFTYKAPGGPSRRIVAYWPGTKTQQEVSATVRLAVATKVSLRVTPRVVRGNRAFTFKGKVFAQDGVSPNGKLVQLQFYNFLRRRWQAGPALVRAGKNGIFKYRYRIKRAPAGSESILFRAYVPAEPSWAYDAGASKARKIFHTH